MLSSRIRCCAPTPLFENMNEPDSDAPSQAKNEPFTRRVTRLLMGSLSRITRAIDSDNTASLLANQPNQPSIERKPLRSDLGDAAGRRAVAAGGEGKLVQGLHTACGIGDTGDRGVAK